MQKYCACWTAVLFIPVNNVVPVFRQIWLTSQHPVQQSSVYWNSASHLWVLLYLYKCKFDSPQYPVQRSIVCWPSVLYLVWCWTCKGQFGLPRYPLQQTDASWLMECCLWRTVYCFVTSNPILTAWNPPQRADYTVVTNQASRHFCSKQLICVCVCMCVRKTRAAV